MACGERADNIPLIVDLDGTLIKVDSLQEAFIQLLTKNPLNALRALFALRRGRAAFKAVVADHVLPDPATTPIDEVVLNAIKQAKQEGRKVYLATAGDRRFAEAIANPIGEFDGVLASEGEVNLKGAAKANRLITSFGAGGFDYIGNEAADMPVWRVARKALVSGAPPSLVKRLSAELPNSAALRVAEFSSTPYLRALRPHQCLKNLLVAVPLIAAHDFSIAGFITVLISFASFSLGASSIYLINDMIDLPHDRAHPEKRLRSLAAGLIPVSHALLLALVVAALSIALALMLPSGFITALVAYFALSIAYSLYLKRKLMIDVVALAALYGIRVVAGGVATGIVLSHWLVGFCFFIFLSLALVKRTAEMVAQPLTSVGNIKGRGYRREDLPTITGLTAASGFVAVLILALYISSDDVQALYRRPELLWGISIILVYWLGRVCFLTGRGEMRHDPVLFAATDSVSLLTGVLVAAVFLAAM